jgi:hypothetical protein
MSRRSRVSGLALGLIAGMLLGPLTSGAYAVPPTRTTEPPLDFDSTSLFCGFPLRAETLRNNVKITTFSYGRQLVTGSHTYRLTNLDTGESIVLTDAGSLTTNPQQTAETFRGRTVLFLYPIEPFGPGAWLFDGRVDATFAEPGGFFYSGLEPTGRSVDLCAVLSQ